MVGRMDGWMDVWRDEWMDAWINEWMDGPINIQTYKTCLNSCIRKQYFYPFLDMFNKLSRHTGYNVFSFFQLLFLYLYFQTIIIIPLPYSCHFWFLLVSYCWLNSKMGLCSSSDDDLPVIGKWAVYHRIMWCDNVKGKILK